MDAGEWQQALECFEEVQRLQPGYRETEELLSRVRREATDRTRARAMSTEAPYFGIDFGTTNSSMAWCDPETGRADVILNEEGEDKTPSVVYFGEDEIIVGKYAEEKLEEVEDSTDPEERDDVSQRIVRSIKRNLLDPPIIPIPGREPVRPVEVVAHILSKLKHDAEEEHFHEEVERVVVTCPATFDAQQKQVLLDGAAIAGFRRVELLEEPVAVALAFTKQGQKLGKGLLIYDLGAGTFDLSVVARDSEDGPFYVLMEPQGDPHFGTDDLDLALYYYCDGIALAELGRHISLTEGTIDLPFLRQCRYRRQNLSMAFRTTFSSFLPSKSGQQQFRHTLDRNTFEDLIRPQIEGTVKMTAELWDQVKDHVDAVVLIGGSSRVPLIHKRLEEALKVELRSFAGKDYAVALGAAYKGYELWIEKPALDTDESPASPKSADEAEQEVGDIVAGDRTVAAASGGVQVPAEQHVPQLPDVLSSETIFISYAREDWDEFVQPLVVTLRQRGFKVWIDQLSIRRGANWSDAIDEALETCERMVLCVSPNSMKSPQAKNEYRYFLSMNKTVIPLVLREARTPYDLASIQFISYEDRDVLIQDLRE